MLLVTSSVNTILVHSYSYQNRDPIATREHPRTRTRARARARARTRARGLEPAVRGTASQRQPL